MSRNTITVLTVLLSVFIILNIYQPGGLTAYILPSICWATVAITTLYMCRFEKIRSWTNKRITFMALLVAFFQIFIFIDAGLINRFGRSPLLFTPSALALNLTLVTTTLLGIELSRGYLTKNLNNRKPTLTLLAITLLYTFMSISILALINFQDPLACTKFIGETFLPTLAENLLATYLALLSGPVASLAYRIPLQAFWWFSPILPDLPWGYKSLIGVMTPTIGFIAINMATNHRDLRKAGIPKQRKLTIEKIKSRKSIKGWLAISVFLVLAVWTSTGLLGFTPTIIASGSMQPTLNPGDIAIVISTPPKAIRVGDIIQYRTAQSQEPTVHRVIDKYEAGGITWFITQGDANNAPDNPISEQQVVGKVIFTIPKLGWVSIYLKECAANAYNFLTVTLPKALTEGGKFILTNSIPITAALTLTAYTYLLLTYHKTTRKEEKT
ncbi:MAG: signal peptidase I [Candidatus Bathyarchaeia archaeon]